MLWIKGTLTNVEVYGRTGHLKMVTGAVIFLLKNYFNSSFAGVWYTCSHMNKSVFKSFKPVSLVRMTYFKIKSIMRISHLRFHHLHFYSNNLFVFFLMLGYV